ncbi:AMP-dependent synthetase/ligase [Actinokineospora sp. NBRC 105648]|uniref:AMP-dependent synthetase/ligase n=1 Tax=Actinokineospora sp. NBRC 105648 TaxID=3032206 RepID=UPI0024A1D4A6|nr:AMP-dependent synthetase/ligase [Actinokineospora sp. NBRC 105648]GLZ36536.1 long-chain acyl-CoA synthetase [Actinokineospora sp. NBRC 105648]
MREFTVAALVEIADDDTLTDAVFRRATETPDRPLFGARVDGAWVPTTYGEFAERVRAVAGGLLAAGVEPGDRVAVLGPTSVDWAVADFAVLSVGAVTVPIYPTASAEQVRHVLRDSGPVGVFVAEGSRALLLSVAADGKNIWTLGEPLPGTAATELLDRRRAAVRADDLATIVYTSGTTGVPKGCLLTHRNILHAAVNVVELLPELFLAEDAATLLFLPLAHVYGRVVLFGCAWAGTRTGLVGDAADLIAELPRFQPTFLVGVPYVLEKVRKAVRARAGAAFDDAEAAAIAHGAAARHGEHRAELPGDPVLEGLRAMLGGRLANMICGGASLDESTLDFFTGVGLRVLGAYGLTETTSTVTMSATGTNRLGTVGRPIPGTAVAVANDGEILVRGPHVSPGYWPDPAGVPEWVRTGDLGELDDDGYLRITGRRKEIIVTSGGKNVAPAPLEDRLRLHPLVSNAMVVGEGRPYVTALITVDLGAAAKWSGEVPAGLQGAVDAANELVSRAESIRRFHVVTGDFTVDRGHLTPSLRLRRAAIAADFAPEIEAMYPRS